MKCIWKRSVVISILFIFPLICVAAGEGQEQTADDMIETLISGLGNPDPITRFAVVLGLAGVEEHREIASAALVEMLNDPDAGVRGAAVLVLGKIGVEDEATITAMTALLEDEDADVRAAAEAALVAPQGAETWKPGSQQAEEPNLANWEPGAPRGPVQADPSGFMGPMTTHHNNLYAIHQRIKGLSNEPKPKDNDGFIKRAKDWIDIGKKGVAEGEALARKLHEMINSETRSGTRAEIGLAQGNVRSFIVIVRDYQLLVGVEPQEDRVKLKQLLLAEAEKFVLEKAKEKIAERFASKGLAEVLNSASWKEAHDAAVSAIISKARERLDRITADTIGLGFHDLNSLKAALRQRVDAIVVQRVGELLINLSGKGLIIRLVGDKVITWLAEEFWKRVKKELQEAFREQGKHELRVNRSIATLRRAQQRLHGLPGNAPLNDLDAAISNADWTIEATQYLVADLSGAVKKHAGGVLTKEELSTILNKKPSPELRMKLQRGEASPEFLADYLLDDFSEERRDVLREKLPNPERFAMIEELAYLVKLNGWIEDVKGAASFTARVRFMTGNREQLLKLSEEEEVLKALVAYLKKLVAAVEIPGQAKKTGTGKQLYLRWYEVLGPEGIVPAEKPGSGRRTYKPGDVRINSLWTEFFSLDPDLAAEHRQYWRNEGRTELADSPLESLPYPSGGKPHHERYDRTYVARITANGQTLFLQHASGLTEYRSREERTWTCGRILGLTEGVNKAQVSAVTEDGIRYDSTISFVVDTPDPRKQQAVESSKKDLDYLRERLAQNKAAGRTSSLPLNLPGNLIQHATSLLNAGQGTPEEILALMTEARQACEQARTQRIEEARKYKRPEDSAHREYIRSIFRIVEVCEWLGGKEAYELGKEAFAAGETAFIKHVTQLRDGGTEIAYDMDFRGTLRGHLRLANLAISAGENGKVAVGHLEDWMKARRELGDTIDEEYEKKNRISWPKDVQF